MTDDELERRLHGWALWRNGSGKGRSSGTTSSIYFQRVTRQRYCSEDVTPPPRIDGEAMDVEGVVSALAPDLRDVLTEVYLRDRYQEDAARALQISLSTLKRRLKGGRTAVHAGLRELGRRVRERRVNR